MSFPQTRLTLIQRLATEGSEDDWRAFLSDYWGPVCRFALRFGARTQDDAEDVALESFELLWRNRLLVSWVSNRQAKLRTLVCSVVRNNLANRARIREGRERIDFDLAQQFARSNRELDEQADSFYAAWADDIVQRAVKSLAAEYCRQGKADYVRVLYGRICQELSLAACAEAMHLSIATVDNYYRHARDRLNSALRDLVQQQVDRYAPAEDFEQELEVEWQRLGQHLLNQGGLEQSVRRAHAQLDIVREDASHEVALSKAFSRIAASTQRARPDQ